MMRFRQRRVDYNAKTRQGRSEKACEQTVGVGEHEHELMEIGVVSENVYLLDALPNCLPLAGHEYEDDPGHAVRERLRDEVLALGGAPMPVILLIYRAMALVEFEVRHHGEVGVAAFTAIGWRILRDLSTTGQGEDAQEVRLRAAMNPVGEE